MTRNTYWLVTHTLFCLLCAGWSAKAAPTDFKTPWREAPFLQGAVARALSGSGAATNDMGESILLNPALVVHGARMTSSFFYRQGAKESGRTQRGLGFLVVDTRTSIPTGLVYFRPPRIKVNLQKVNLQKDPTKEPSKKPQKGYKGFLKEEFLQLSTGHLLGSKLALGASAIVLRSKLYNELKPAKNTDSTQTWYQWQGVLGAHWTPNPNVGLGMAWYSFVPKGSDGPEGLQMPSKFVFAMSHVFNQHFRWRVDVSRPLKVPKPAFSLSGGFESFLGKFFVLRAGTFWGRRDPVHNPSNKRKLFFSWGAGFIAPKLHVNYSYQKRQPQLPHHSLDLVLALR